ncbi:MAG: ABC transporter permease subunit [Candidatus Fusobacterium pullicola]|uniref:ABC transporter permease subunit n=1 Tax=Candidatus Fusobacterium pullicola TaxID=2838601 RepID=A0A9E2NY67_9FUSO|nr:ABC transporter permease subunit [Candidatus Fusobacterium pullicola]
MKRDLGKYIVNGIYIVLWLTPIYFFAKDFFEISSLEILKERYLKEVVMFSIKQGLYSTIIALLIGLIPAYYTAYRKDNISKLIQGLVFIPFFFPVISIVTIFSIIFNLPLIKEWNILYTLKGIIVANVFYNSPIFVKYISEGLKKIPKELEEAMRIDGAGAFIIFLKGQLPIILPQIFRAFILVFTYCFLGLGIILSLGGIKYSNIEVEIANTLMGGADFSKAMILGGIQFIILLALNFLGLFIKEYEIYGEQEEKNLNPLFKIYSLIYMLFQYGVIILTFLLSFVNQYTGKFSIKAYYNLFSHEFNENYEIINSIINSFGISAIVSIITVFLIYVIIKNYSRLTDIIIFSNMGISGAFLAITLYYMNILFNIPLIILLAVGYIIGAIPIGYSFMYQYIKKFPITILEAAELDCKNFYQRFRYVDFPILKNIFISSFLQIFAVIFGEFTVVYTMQLGDILPIASLVNYSLVSNKKYMESSAFSAIILFIVLGAFLLGEYFKERD